MIVPATIPEWQAVWGVAFNVGLLLVPEFNRVGMTRQSDMHSQIQKALPSPDSSLSLTSASKNSTAVYGLA